MSTDEQDLTRQERRERLDQLLYDGLLTEREHEDKYHEQH